jgi:hypothetical protein
MSDLSKQLFGSDLSKGAAERKFSTSMTATLNDVSKSHPTGSLSVLYLLQTLIPPDTMQEAPMTTQDN